jgi:FkbM family methyltransferase
MGDRVSPIAAGLGVKREILSLNMNQINGGEAGHALDTEIVFKGKLRTTNYKQAILGISLDQLVSDFNIPSPDYIKIDVDGTEDKILEGAKNTLMNHNLKSILIEFDDAEISVRLTRFLLQYGFKIRHRDINPNSGNVIFDRF